MKIMFNELNVELSMEEITKVIKQLKSGKACGPDLVLN